MFLFVPRSVDTSYFVCAPSALLALDIQTQVDWQPSELHVLKGCCEEHRCFKRLG